MIGAIGSETSLASRMFQRADANGNGSITKAELTSAEETKPQRASQPAQQMPTVEELFAELDADGSGGIDLTEMEAHIAERVSARGMGGAQGMGGGRGMGGAQGMGGNGGGGPQGMGGGGQGGSGGAVESSQSTTSTESTDEEADANGDGIVTEAEQLAYEMARAAASYAAVAAA